MIRQIKVKPLSLATALGRGIVMREGGGEVREAWASLGRFSTK